MLNYSETVELKKINMICLKHLFFENDDARLIKNAILYFRFLDF